MKKYTTVTHYELNMSVKSTSRKHQVQPLIKLSIMDLFCKLQEWGYEKSNRTFGRENFCGIIPVIKIDVMKNRIDILLCLADKEADTPETLDFINRNRRTLKTKGDEGINTRGHIVIKTDPNTPTVARFAIEHKTGITAKLFIDTINYFLRDAKKENPEFFVGNHPTDRKPDGSAKTINFGVRLNYSALLSDDFIEAFKTGRIKDVQFEVPVTNKTPYDPVGIFVPQKEVGYLDVTASIHKLNQKKFGIDTIKQAFDSLIKAKPNLKNSTFKIHYSDVNGRHHTVTYDPLVKEFALVKKTYTKHHKINPDNLEIIPELCDTIFNHLT